jgi:hypothetical protein
MPVLRPLRGGGRGAAGAGLTESGVEFGPLDTAAARRDATADGCRSPPRTRGTAATERGRSMVSGSATTGGRPDRAVGTAAVTPPWLRPGGASSAPGAARRWHTAGSPPPPLRRRPPPASPPALPRSVPESRDRRGPPRPPPAPPRRWLRRGRGRGRVRGSCTRCPVRACSPWWGTTTSGTPCQSPSIVEFMPPWVTKTSAVRAPPTAAPTGGSPRWPGDPPERPGIAPPRRRDDQPLAAGERPEDAAVELRVSETAVPQRDVEQRPSPRRSRRSRRSGSAGSCVRSIGPANR